MSKNNSAEHVFDRMQMFDLLTGVCAVLAGVSIGIAFHITEPWKMLANLILAVLLLAVMLFFGVCSFLYARMIRKCLREYDEILTQPLRPAIDPEVWPMASEEQEKIAKEAIKHLPKISKEEW